MMPSPKVDSNYRMFVELQLSHCNLLAQGKDESPESEELEARMTALWRDLDDAQRKSLNGMGSDLNWLRSRGASPPKGRIAADVTEKDWADLESAQQNKDCHAILHHLRVCAPAIPQDILAHSRATCYFNLNFPEIAILFAELAVDIELAEVMKRVSLWPMPMRNVLARQILESLEGSPITASQSSKSGVPPFLSTSEIVNLLKREKLAPANTTVKQWIAEYRMEMYGK